MGVVKIAFFAGLRVGAGKGTLSLVNEWNNIETAITKTPSYHQGRLTAVQVHDTTLPVFIDKLVEYRPQIVHFAGHGAYRELRLFNADGSASAFTLDQARELFRTLPHRVRLLVLTACDSYEMASSLTQEGLIDYAIGTKGKLEDSVATNFASYFYGHIEENLRKAFEISTQQLHGQSSAEGLQWCEWEKAGSPDLLAAEGNPDAAGTNGENRVPGPGDLRGRTGWAIFPRRQAPPTPLVGKMDCGRRWASRELISSLVFLQPDRAVSGGSDGSPILWDLTNGARERIFFGHERGISRLAEVPGSPQAVSSSFDSTLRVWDLKTGQGRALEAHVSSVRHLFVAQDAQSLFCLFRDISEAANNPRPGRWCVGKWSLTKTGKEERIFLKVLKEEHWIAAARNIPGQTALIYGTAGGRVAWIDAESDEEPKTLFQIDPESFVETAGGDAGKDVSVRADSIDISRDGRYLAAGITKSTRRSDSIREVQARIEVWDLSARKCVRTLQDHTGPVPALRFTSDGQHVISGAVDGTVRIWNLHSKDTPVGSFQGHYGSVTAIDVMPGGDQFLSGSLDGTVRLWSLKKACRLTENNPDHLGRIRAIAIDGARAATASFDNSITIWQLPGGRRLATLKPPDVEKGQIRDVAFAKNGKMLISAHSDGAVRRWDLRDLNHCREIDFHKKHTRDVFGVAVTPDGRIVLSASEDKTLCIWRPEENRFDFLPGRPRENDGFLLDLVRLAIRPFLPGREDDADVDGDDRDYVGHSSGVNTVAITGDGLRAVSGSDDMNVRRWNLESEESGAFKYSKVMRRQRFGSCSHRHQVLDVAISRDGRKALSASKDGTVKLWDLDRGIELLKLDAHSGWVVAVAFGREDEWAASVSVDGDVRIWDLRDAASLEKERLLAYYPTEAPLFSCAVTPDGDMIVAGDTAGRLHFFDVKYPASVERRVP